jgi:hypothetical protein
MQGKRKSADVYTVLEQHGVYLSCHISAKNHVKWWVTTLEEYYPMRTKQECKFCFGRGCSRGLVLLSIVQHKPDGKIVRQSLRAGLSAEAIQAILARVVAVRARATIGYLQDSDGERSSDL